MDTDAMMTPADGAVPDIVDPYEAQRRAEAEQMRLQQVMAGLIGRLEREADARVQKRQLVEKRWLEDLRQLHGEYDQGMVAELTNAKRSTLFVNETRPKTNACEARLVDMLFPTDDKNWGIQPTPVPELTQAAKQAVGEADRLIAEANHAAQQGAPGHEQLAQAAQAKQDEAARLKAEMDEARRRADAMTAEINDQLTECRYNIQSRDVIRDACRIGTGIFKGPVANTDRTRRGWQPVTDERTGQQIPGLYALSWQEDARPAFYRVDPWSWFPDPDAKTVEESADFFERHLMSKKDLRALARCPGFDQDAIRALLRHNPAGALPSYLADLRQITNENQAPSDARYQVWEYRGQLSADEMRDMCACLGKGDLMESLGEEIDPLAEVGCVLWFCQGEVLKFSLQPLDSGEPIYSVFNLEKDDASIWGFGIPYLMRDAQKAINGAWRMLMDNAGLATGPQIEIDPEVVEPVDGDWTLRARKEWRRKTTAPAGKPGINTYDIPIHTQDLLAIINVAKQLIDDETSISEIAQGEQGSHTTQTAQGMTLLMNSVNVVFRRFVKNFDDDVTTPNIRRIYDWNMQFSKREDIKGDYEVDARGSSVLLVREMQAQNLMALAGFTAHPTLGPLLKASPLLRKLVQSMMVTADEVVKTDDEIQQDAEAQAQQQPQPDPRAEIEKMKIEAQKEAAQMDAQIRIRIAEINRDTELIRLATTQNLKLEDLRAKSRLAQMDRDHDERIFAAEVGFKDRQSARDAAASAVTAAPHPAPARAGTRFPP